MNIHSPSFVRVITLALAAASVALAGCGTIDEGEGAEYPQGQYEQVAVTAPPQQQLSLEAYPPSDPTVIAIGEDTTQYAETDPAALTQFRSTLDPVGDWYDDPTYGTVWSPHASVVGADFTPYVTAGHWTYDDDYVWVSDYDWGWAPFHYGRWVFVDGRGWCWIPGRRYAGAWVTWRVGPVGFGYVGWAPLPPTWYWRGGYAYGLYAAPSPRWTYCGTRDVFAPVVATRVVPPQSAPAIAAATRPYVPASPGVTAGGRVAAHPDVVGPPPSRLGIVGNVPRAPLGGAEPAGRGLAQAQSLARPPIVSSPQAPRTHTQTLQSSPNAIGRGPLPEIGPRATTPRYGAGSGFTPSPSPSYRSSPSFGASPSYSSPSFRSSPSFGAGGGSSPSFRSSPSFGAGGGSSPSFRSSPSFGAGSRPAPSLGARPNTGGHSGPIRSSPGFRRGR
jgi:hypothetical protein